MTLCDKEGNFFSFTVRRRASDQMLELKVTQNFLNLA